MTTQTKLIRKEELRFKKVAPLQRECDELTAIFVSIIKSSRRNTTTS